MDKRRALKIAKQFVETLPKEYAVKKAFLFGSYAKGSAHDYSDIDVALVLKKCESRYETMVKLMLIGMKLDISIEPHPMSEKDFKEGSSLINEIKKHGILL